jgi:DNA repair photolyase
MKPRPVSNPPSRFADLEVAYDEGEGPPPATVTILEDHSRTILSHNDSPDLGFSWSVNPYRGCLHSCAYCIDGATPILLGDGRTRPIAELRVGDEIYGTTFDGKYRRYARTTVRDQWTTTKPAHRIVLSDGTELIASGDHRFLSNRGWKHVIGAEHGPLQRPHLTINNLLRGTGRFALPPSESVDYRVGYLCGMIRGDATLRRYDYSGRRRDHDIVHQFRLALADLEALRRSKRYLAELAVETTELQFQEARVGFRAMQGIRTSTQAAFARISEIIAWPQQPSVDWHKGFLAGIFDAEGSRSRQILRIANADAEMVEQTVEAFERLGFDCVVETRPPRPGLKTMHAVRLRGGLQEHLRFFHTTDPAITRKRDLAGQALEHSAELRVLAIEPIGERVLYDITTGTGDFIADGVVSHNCYARPTHEYLDLGAGTDFDTKIVVKPKAAELLRAAFDKPSWKGEHVMFSGVTDCYQAIEAQLGLTRGCLEVCLEYRNPVSIITKSALVERDVGLIAELAREAGAWLAVSLAWIDADDARALEPWAPSPARRLKVIETFARAGVPVSLMAAPIIPGLNDDQIPRLLEAARDAGATRAGWTLLRLPGAVAQIFPERLRAAMPLSADKVLHRIGATRGGEELVAGGAKPAGREVRLNDSRFHSRFRGEGVYAAAIAGLFEATATRLGLRARHLDEDDGPQPSRFRRPAPRTGQLPLF